MIFDVYEVVFRPTTPGGGGIDSIRVTIEASAAEAAILDVRALLNFREENFALERVERVETRMPE